MYWFYSLVLGASLLLSACTTTSDKKPVPYGTYILQVKTAAEMPKSDWLGVAYPAYDPCVIWIRHQSELGPYSFDQVLKHEAAHCHGWEHDGE